MAEFLDKNMQSFFTKGALITSGEKPNTMTASWGFVGYMWRKKVVVVPIRKTRYTKEFVDKTGEFTVSIPEFGEMNKEIGFCGSKSGRDTDKYAALDMKISKAKSVNTYVVDGCAHYFECKVLLHLPITSQNCPDELKDSFYADGNYHEFYFGEVIAEY